MDLSSIRVAPITFHPHARRDPVGFFIGPDGITGLDGVGMRLEQINIPGQRGSFAFTGDLDSRTLSISGTCNARSVRELRAFKQTFTGLLGHGGLGRVIVGYSDESFSLEAQRIGVPQFKEIGLMTPGQDYYSAAFQLQLWAPDPLLYGERQPFGPALNLTQVPVFHRGNAESPAVFTVTRQSGTITAYAVYNSRGDGYKVIAPLTAGHPHTIDMDSGDLIIDGAVQLGGREDATTWGILPGAPENHFIDVIGGTAALTGYVKDAVA